MAVSVATFPAHLLAHESPRHDTRPLTVPSDDARGSLKTRIKALVGYWESLSGLNASQPNKRRFRVNATANERTHCGQGGPARELLEPRGTTPCESAAPPAYEDCLNDVPPDYTTTDALATAQILRDSEIIDLPFEDRKAKDVQIKSIQYLGDVKVDFTETDNIRTHANKKAKKAAKAAQQAKWADSDNEDKKDGEDGGAGDENKDGGGDAGAGGDGGGDPPGGGGGGDDDDEWWNGGGGGKKKKDKKKKSVTSHLQPSSGINDLQEECLGGG